ncbi:hypothetical protein ACH41H_36245 [Streptomyces sp. NPDC020800]|uniref:hypothetical protein n=1 Tax=Streptomyces sp. NPDC020800 TaxID=3365092 RepID=UPI00378EE804
MSRITRRDVGDAATGLGAGTILVIVVVFVGLIVASLLWAFGVFTSGAKGAGDVRRDQNNAKNREHWSVTFNSEFQQLQADQEIVVTLKRQAEAAGATAQDRDNYLGAQNNCRQDVAQYNADASSALGSPWVPEELPTHVDSDTYCGS